MSSRRPGRRIRTWLRLVLAGLVLMLLSLYVLLVTGALGEGPGLIAGALASTDSVTVRFSGLRSDLFWSTSADSVVVTGIDGLSITVDEADVKGSVLDFLLFSHVDTVTVSYLDIALPETGRDPEAPPDSLTSILSGIDEGIVVSADRLLLANGRIMEGSVTVLDSMRLDCSVNRVAGVVLEVDSAGIHLPDLGTLEGFGNIMMAEGVVSSDGFTAVALPGSLTVAGTLEGEDEKLDLILSGRASTRGLGLPVDLSFMLDGSLRGTLSDLVADLGIREGEAALFGIDADFSADTLTADLNGVSVRNLSVSTDDASLHMDGSLDFTTMEWEAALDLGMSGTDISRYFDAGLETSISGNVTAGLSGRNGTGFGGRATLDLTSSSTGFAQVSGVRLEASLDGSDVGLSGTVTAGGGTVTFSGQGSLGPGMMPQSWSLQAEGNVNDFRFLRQFSPSEIPDVSYAWFSVRGTGSRFGMNLRGSAGVRELATEEASADQVTVSGTLNYASANVAGRIPVGIGFDGDLEALGVSAGGVFADTARVEGVFRASGRRVSAQAGLSLDSLRFASQVLHAEAGISMDDGDISVSDILFTGSGEREYSAEMSVSMGDTTFFDLSEIRAAHSKLRLITGGSLSGYAADGTLVLDTLWLDPPVGDLAMSGMIGEELLRLRVDVNNIDLSSFSTFSGLPGDMSGVGDFSIFYSRDTTSVRGAFTGRIASPAYGQFRMDSITVDISALDDVLSVDGIYAWHDDVRSGLQLRASDTWTGTEISLLWDKIQWLELEVNDLSDWLFYVLPLPVRTMGASVSARVEYERYNGDYDFQMQASARINRLYITLLGIELPNVNFYLSYPDSSARGYDTRFTLGSGSQDTGNFSSTWRADIESLFPFRLGDYSIDSQLSEMEIAIPGIGAVICSGNLGTEGSGLDVRPLLSGKLRILEGAVGIPQPVGTSSGGGSGDMPFDISIDVSGTGDIWFRTTFADIEMSLKLRIFTLERKPTVNGTVSAVRGRITLLQRDFQITEGTVSIIQGHPPTMQLNVEASTTVRSAISHQEYHITVLIHGTAENPEVNLTGFGPAGQISQEDILTLLAAGLTYGEMQQMNSSAIRSEVESVAQSMLGNLLARNIRHEIGLDTFEISPELLSDTTSLILNVGKYVLPDLYVSYKDDVFSGDPGTVSAQYLFSSDFYIEGSSRTTIHGYLEPTVELHYTIRY